MGQIKAILDLFEGEYNPIILEKLMKDTYTREAINNLRLKVAKIDKFFKRCFFMPGWSALSKRARVERRKSFLITSQTAYKYYLKIKDGEYLDKYNYSSNGHRKQFFKIVDQKVLKWADKDKDIAKAKASHSYELGQIRGLVYGKATSTFLKKSNKDLYPWLCMSLIMENRPFDIVCSEDNANAWYIGLAYAIKKHNPNAYCLSVGKFLWRKMKLLLVYLVIDRMSADQRKNLKKDLSLAKALCLYKKLKLSNT
jgi:hypothetical protein